MCITKEDVDFSLEILNQALKKLFTEIDEAMPFTEERINSKWMKVSEFK